MGAMVPHAIIVDFAISLLVVSVGADLLASVVEERDLRVLGRWTLFLGTIASALSVVSGLVAASRAGDAPEVVRTVALHRNLAIASLACFAACFAWRASSGVDFPRRYGEVYWGLSMGGLGALVVAAYFGGLLVFRLGVGVAPP